MPEHPSPVLHILRRRNCTITIETADAASDHHVSRMIDQELLLLVVGSLQLVTQLDIFAGQEVMITNGPCNHATPSWPRRPLLTPLRGCFGQQAWPPLHVDRQHAN